MKKAILLTRPLAASRRAANLLACRGYECGVEPLLTIEPTHAPRPVGLFQAVWITSANTLDAIRSASQDIKDLLRLPCFCVGSATGAAARASGFLDIKCGVSDSSELARLTADFFERSYSAAKRRKRLIHIGREAVVPKAKGILELRGVDQLHWPVYRAAVRDDFSAETKLRLARGYYGALPVFSPWSAKALVSLIEKNDLTGACPDIIAIGLSQAVADVLQKLPWRQLRVAAKPEEEEVFACL